MEPRSRGERRTLESLRNAYAGRRAFIIGNGPSLRRLDLSRLAGEVTFGVNGIFYLFDELGFKPTFYMVEDKLFAEDRVAEVNSIRGTTRIFGDYLRYCFDDAEDVIWANVRFEYREYPGFPHFSRDASEHLWVGGTVTYLCMQLAYFMGFQDVYLVGFDHSYTIPKDAIVEGNAITSCSDDPNHFHPAYFGAGKRWHLPRTDRMERAYLKADRAFRADGRRIHNASAGGQLEVFERVDYDSLFPRIEPVGPPSEPVRTKQETARIRISAIVCTYRNPQLLERTLRSLQAQTLERAHYEVIVVDNASGDRTPEVAAGFAGIRYVLETRQGLSHARNAGIAAAAGDVIAFIDDDAEADPGWLGALLAVYERVPEALAVGGRALPIWGGERPHWLGEAGYRSLSLLDWGEQARPLEWPERIIGVNCSFRREVFERFGLFDAELGRLGSFLLGCEDVAIQQRIQDSGGMVYYSPDAVVHHLVPKFRLTRRYAYLRRLGSKLDEAIFELRKVGLEAQVGRILAPLRERADLGMGSNAHAEVLVEAVRQAFALLRSTSAWPAFEERTLGSPPDRQRRRARASDAVARGDWPAAEKDLRAIAQGLLIDAEAYIPVIELLILSGHLEEAAEEIDLARILNFCSASLLFLRGIVCHHLGDLEGAREALRGALAANSDDVEGWLALGKVELDMDLVRQAARSYGEATRSDPDRVEAWIGLARSAHARSDEALRDRALERVEALAAGHAEIPRVRAGTRPEFGPEQLLPVASPAPLSPGPATSTESDAAEGPALVAASTLSRAELGDRQPGLQFSVIVCTHRNPELLERTLDSLCALTLQPERFEIIVVDNDSSDSTPQVVARYDRVRYVLEPERGLGRARNSGLRVAGGEILAFIDDDAEAAPDWLGGLLEVYERFPAAWAVGGKALPLWEAKPPDWLDENYHRALSLIDWGERMRPLVWPERIIGVNCSFRRQTFLELGGFDPALGRTGSFLLGSEDTEIQRRIHASGGAVYYTPHAVVRHRVPAERMTRRYLFERQLGNLVSHAIELLREGSRHAAIDEVRECLKGAVETDPRLGSLRSQVGLLADALRCAFMALRGTPQGVEFQATQLATPEEMQRMLRAAGAALQGDDWGGAEGLLRQLVHRAPTHPQVYLPLIDLLTISGRPEEAGEVVECAVAANPGSPVLLRKLGENRHLRGRLADAAGILQVARETAPGDPATLAALGKLHADLGEGEVALGHLREAVAMGPNDVECWIEIARGARTLAEGPLLREAVEQGRGLAPERPEWAELLAAPSAEERRARMLRHSRVRLERFRNAHRGERCVIIGNGPSLNRMDLGFLRDEITFGLNRIYLLGERMDFQPSYYVCMNPLVLEQSRERIAAIPCPRFLSAQGADLFPDLEDTVLLQPMPGPDFATDPAGGLWEGHTVTYVALQLAYYMGFSEVVLIGVDHHYEQPPGAPNQEVVSAGDDPNHFHPDYFGRGVRWQLPDLANSELAYRLARERFEADGRRIVDATVDGRLEIFPKRDYREIFDVAAPLEPAVAPEPAPVDPVPACSAARVGARYRVSAIVSTYKAEHLLRACLEDLVGQTLGRSLEIIVVDSGSTQNEERIVREFQAENPNIVYLRTQRETLYQAWNRGVLISQGERVTNANTDDRHRPDACAQLADALDRLPVGIVYADSLITTGENQTFERNTADRTWRLPAFSVRQVLMDCPFGPQPMWRRALHDDVGLFEGHYRLAGDYEFFMRLALRHGAAHLDETLGLYYESARNLSYDHAAMRLELDQFLGRVRSVTPLEQIYPFLEGDGSDDARTAACLDFANHLVWKTPYPGLEHAEELYRKLIVRVGPLPEGVHNLALCLLLQKRMDEGIAALRPLAASCPTAAENLRLLEGKGPLNPRMFRVLSLPHPGLGTLKPVVPAWETRVPLEVGLSERG